MNGCLWSLYICFWAFSLLLLPWVYVFWGEELLFLKVHPFIFLWPLRWPVRPCFCVLCFGVKSSCSWRCIHSETLEGRQQIEKYGTPICVEGLFWKIFVRRSNNRNIPPPCLDLYSELGGQEASSDPKLCDTRPGTGKRAKVNHWQGKVEIKSFSPRRSRQRERTSSAILRERHRPRYSLLAWSSSAVNYCQHGHYSFIETWFIVIKPQPKVFGINDSSSQTEPPPM